jgi:major membrane immunogen (membrane-anchored lipoprotein)
MDSFNTEQLTYAAIIFAVILLVIVVGLVARHRAIKKFGRPVLAADIQCVKDSFSQYGLEINYSDFILKNKHEKRKHYEKTYVRESGIWTLELELNDGEIVAYAYDFKSNYSRMLSEGRSISRGSTKFINID